MRVPRPRRPPFDPRVRQVPGRRAHRRDPRAAGAPARSRRGSARGRLRARAAALAGARGPRRAPRRWTSTARRSACWRFARGALARRAARARLQPDARGARLAVDPHRGRDRQRRHAVPGRLGEHGAQPPAPRDPPHPASGDRASAATTRARWSSVAPSAEAPAAMPRESFMHVEIDRRTDPAVLASIRAETRAACSTTCAPRSRTGEPMRERVHAVLAELERRRRRSTAPRSSPRARSSCAGSTEDHFTFLGYREYDLVTEDGEHDAAAPVEGTGLGILRDGRRDGAAERRPRCRRRASELARERELLDPHQGQLALDRPPPDPARLRRRQALRRGGRGRWASADSSASTPQRAYNSDPWRDPARAAQGRARARALGRAPAAPRRQGAGRRSSSACRATSCSRPPRTSCSRSRSASCASRNASACGSSCGPTAIDRFFACAGVRAARPLQHRDAREDPAHPARGARRPRDRVLALALASRSSRASTSSSARARTGVPADERATPTRDRARGIGRATPRCATGATSSSARSTSASARSAARRWSQRYGEAFPAGYRDDFDPRAAVSDIERMDALDGPERSGALGLPPARGADRRGCGSSSSAASRSFSPRCCRSSRTWASR